jgi:endonuclease IV
MASIKEAFEAQRKYKIFASSLLMSYDAEAVAKFKIGKICEIDELKKHVNIRLIDFAHVFDANGERDENFLEGLGNLLELFKNYLKQLQKNNTNQ